MTRDTDADGLDVGILADGPVMRRWAAEAVERALEDAGASIELVVLSADGDDGGRSWRHYVESALDYGAWTPVIGLHQVVNPPSYMERVPMAETDWFADADVIRARPEPADGFGQVLPAEAVDRIEDADVDVLFRRGFGILKGDVLETPSHGVLSYHHGNVREYRGRPPGVWEFANDEPTAGVTLQRLTPTLDGGEIVVEKEIEIGEFRTWQAIKRELFERSTDMLATACRRLGDPSFEPTVPEDLGDLYTVPDAVETARIEAKNSKGRVLNLLEG